MNIEKHSFNQNRILITIDEIDHACFFSLLDEYLVQICVGYRESSKDEVKRALRSLFSKKNQTWICGAVAELFLGVYLLSLNYEQCYLFQNLEERSSKKGFDGVYKVNDELWILESKATAVFKRRGHKEKVLEAIGDIIDKIECSSEDKNNPWKNAYYHANLRDLHTTEDTLQFLKDMERDYYMGRHHSIEEFNNIPCGTIIDSIDENRIELSSLINDFNGVLDSLLGRKVNIICVSMKTTEWFLDYINEDLM